jgi:transcriptional regulator with PAS, ATPase and Fis domain
MQLLVEHPWPGNVSQLRQCLLSLVGTADAETLEVNHLPRLVADEWRDSADSCRDGLTENLADLERRAVRRALTVHHGNRTLAAQSLGISVRTLQRKLKDWDHM